MGKMMTKAELKVWAMEQAVSMIERAFEGGDSTYILSGEVTAHSKQGTVTIAIDLQHATASGEVWSEEDGFVVE
jgi:hypothetical protein